MQQTLNRPKQLITKQYGREVGRPQNHRPVARCVIPKVRGYREKLHKRQREHASQSQENLLFNFSSALTVTPDEQEKEPRPEKGEEQHVPTGIEVKQYIHAADQISL
jgi:hypothetical protein